MRKTDKKKDERNSHVISSWSFFMHECRNLLNKLFFSFCDDNEKKTISNWIIDGWKSLRSDCNRWTKSNGESTSSVWLAVTIIDSQSDALDININELEIDSIICLFTRSMNKLERLLWYYVEAILYLIFTNKWGDQMLNDEIVWQQ